MDYRESKEFLAYLERVKKVILSRSRFGIGTSYKDVHERLGIDRDDPLRRWTADCFDMLGLNLEESSPYPITKWVWKDRKSLAPVFERPGDRLSALFNRKTDMTYPTSHLENSI